MFSGEAFSKLSTVTPLPELMSNPAALEQNTELVVARAGIFHLFFDPVVRAQEHLLQYLPSSAKTVLDVGCALGLTGKLLEERLGCQVTGIEQDPDLASLAAKNISRVIVGNVEELEIVDRYDIIVAIDLVEHLLFPDKFLEKMHAALNPGGRLLICVPNIGHYTIVEDLLCGRWDIMPGFLNYMHFRFFTRSALEKLLAMSGFSQFTFYNEITVLPPRYLQLPDGFKIDEDSLKTARFYVTANRSP
jgi:2-polyprenyl-3-methyl-5-hydroxy-6-metoxy-1,4-benzoquinol methylase